MARGRGDIYDSSSSDDDSAAGSSSGSGSSTDDSSSGDSSSYSGSSSSESGSGSDSDSIGQDFKDGSQDENFEVGFWDSLKAVLPWTELGREADYAEERLDAHDEFKEELDEALRIRKMVDTGLHDLALDRLMASTEGQMYHHFHKHRYELEQSGEWSFIPPSVRRKWRHATNKTDKVEKLRAYMAMRRDRFLRIRQVRGAHLSSSDLVVTVMPESLIDENLLEIAGGSKKKKPAAAFGGMRLKKCHWQDTNSKGELCTCTNYRMEHPHRVFKDDLGVLIHDTLATCGWHATHCVSDVHGIDPVVISTANEGALCNECLVQLTKGPIRNTTAFGAPGVRFKNKRAGTADGDAGAGGEEFLAWNKWFTKGPGRARKSAIRPRHPQAPPGLPPAGLRPPAVFVPPPPPPPVFSMANFRRQKRLAKWRLHKEEKGKWAATAMQRTYRGYRARHLRTMVALEHPLRAQLRVESAIVMQSLVRRFLARTLVRQIAAFRNVNATAIQRIVRGMQARALFRKKRAQAIVKRQMMVFITKAFVAAAKVAKRVREEMRKKHAVALSFQRAWRGKKGREKAAVLRATVLRRQGAAISVQKLWRCFSARRELEARRAEYRRRIRAAIVMQSVARMFAERRRVGKMRIEVDAAARKLQPVIRGLLARQLARREKALLGQVWGWLGTDSTTANDIYARFLPKNTYSSVSRSSVSDEGLKQSSSSGLPSATGTMEIVRDKGPGTGPFLDRMSLETLPGERHFTEKFDKDRTGTCSKVEFKIGLGSFLREVGYPLQKEEAALIVKRYFDGDGFCAWHSFLKSYHAGDRNGSKQTACTRHGRLLCTLCIRHGRCEKPGCGCTKPKAGRSKQLGFKMCECGHVFDAHALVVGGSKPLGLRRRGWVLPEKQLNSLLAKGVSKTPIDRPVNVEGCSAAAATLRPPRAADAFHAGGATRPKSPQAEGVATGAASGNGLLRLTQGPTPYCAKRSNERRQRAVAVAGKRQPRRGAQHQHEGQQGDDVGGVTALSLAELSPPFFGNAPARTAAASATSLPPSPSRQKENAMPMPMPMPMPVPEQHRTEVLTLNPGPKSLGGTPGPEYPRKRKAAPVPTLREAKDREEERRDASWAGRRGQAERAALAEMSSAVQGKNAADYAVRLQDDIATNTSIVDGRLALAPVMSKKELRKGFAISTAVPFIKAGTLKVTTDPIGLYLYLLKAFSDERHELLEDDRRFTDFVARHAVFLERHWCKLVKDIRNGTTDPHLPITEGKRMRVEGLMIPNKKRAQRLDDRLRVLGFHARASGVYKTAASASTSANAAADANPAGQGPSARTGGKQSWRQGDEPENAGRKSRSASSRGRAKARPITQEEKQESMAKMVEACKKKRPGTSGGESGVDKSSRRKRRTVTAGEIESSVRLLKSRGESRARSPSAGAIQAIPTAEEASRTAYGLLTAASANAAGITSAPSGRGVRKHVCLHPGCGKVFHLKASAEKHQEKEHRFRRRLAASTPLTDQFMHPVWPSDGVPWAPGSQSSGPLTAGSAKKKKPHRRGHSSSANTVDSTHGDGGHGKAGRGREHAANGDVGETALALGGDESNLHARFACGVPGCGHRFPLARLLGLHMRMGHSDFDLERMRAARDGTGATHTLDGVPVTAEIDVGGRVRASFLGAYRLVPPFRAPIGCPAIPACAQHSRLKHGCRCCEDVAQRSAAASAPAEDEGESEETARDARRPLGLPLPPAKFYTRARVVVSHHGRPTKLDLDCTEPLRCPLLSFPFPYTCPGLGHGHDDDDHGHLTVEVEMDPADPQSGAPQGSDDDDDRGKTTELAADGHAGGRDQTTKLLCGGDVHGGGGGEEQPQGTASGDGSSCGGGAQTSSGKRQRDVHPPSQQQRHQNHEPHHHNGSHGLVPARLVAVLVDGSGKGWMAARRLWSVREVGFQALLEAGLSAGDVDLDQEFFVGTEVEYLPLSLLWDTCAVKVDRRDDVHSKQRVGDLPKPLRYVSHGIDSATGAVLLESELKRREEELLLDGGLDGGGGRKGGRRNI